MYIYLQHLISITSINLNGNSLYYFYIYYRRHSFFKGKKYVCYTIFYIIHFIWTSITTYHIYQITALLYFPMYVVIIIRFKTIIYSQSTEIISSVAPSLNVLYSNMQINPANILEKHSLSLYLHKSLFGYDKVYRYNDLNTRANVLRKW